CAFINDITTRILAQKEILQQDSKLADLQLKLDAIMEATQTAWLEINLKTEEITLANQAEAILGITDKAKIHYNWFLANMDEKDRQDFEKMLISAIDHQYNFQFDFKFRTPKGKELQCTSSVKLLKSEGKVNRLLMTLQAKEARKKTERNPKEK
ncbi:MAG: hypothetical protein NZ108_01025, partial [Bacteroidia bacterium]|nr:hypothetical protein [Bacteroidia bacterium]